MENKDSVKIETTNKETKNVRKRVSTKLKNHITTKKMKRLRSRTIVLERLTSIALRMREIRKKAEQPQSSTHTTIN